MNRRFRRKETNTARFGRYKQKDKQEKSSYILNLSSKTLSQPQLSLLSKGLGFVPTIDRALDFTEGIQCLTRTLRIRYRFQEQDRLEQETEKYKPPPFKPKSTWAPPQADPATELYLSSLPLKLSSLEKGPCLQNLSRAEWRALSSLRKDSSLVIKKADKGSCLVVEDTREYIADGLTHLADTDIYKPVSEDPTAQLSEAINQFVTRLEKKGHIDRNTRDYLINNPGKVRTQQLYFLKKIHKGPHTVRPIVSGSSGPTEKVSAFLDYFLQPLLPDIPSHIKDSKHVIMLLEKHSFLADCILSTIDVKSLYLNIPHEEGVKSALHHLYHLNSEADDVPFPETTAEALLRTVLEQNYFEFNSSMYHQTWGTAMGTKMAPAYATIFMADLEQRLINSFTRKPLLWKRFIDDILAIWPGDLDEVKTTLNCINSAHNTIKFTSEVSPDHIVFLDLEIYKGKRFRETGKLDIRPHFKPTNKFQYLHHGSSHPRATFKGVVRGELTRILRSSAMRPPLTTTENFSSPNFEHEAIPRPCYTEQQKRSSFKIGPRHSRTSPPLSSTAPHSSRSTPARLLPDS